MVASFWVLTLYNLNYTYETYFRNAIGDAYNGSINCSRNKRKLPT